jgi:mRNA interferase ChpB
MMRIPARGEIWLVNLYPTVGREQQGMRPVLVVSEKGLNSLGLSVVCPVTQGGQQSRFSGFAVSLMGTGSQTQGIVMCNQPRTIDMAARHGRFIEVASESLIEEVLARLQPVFEA